MSGRKGAISCLAGWWKNFLSFQTLLEAAGHHLSRAINCYRARWFSVPHAYYGATLIVVAEILNDGEILKDLHNLVYAFQIFRGRRRYFLV